MVVAVNKNRFFLWQHSPASAYLEGKDHILAGQWSQVMVPESMEMPKMSNHEACLSGIFTSTSVRLYVKRKFLVKDGHCLAYLLHASMV